MPVRVLVVDDSGFFRRRVAEMLAADSRLEVVATASNGREAVDQTLLLKPDVITMDIEMPVLDGISAVKQIMERRPTPILMFSSLTTDGAKPTFDALDAGAVDYLPKRFEDISRDRQEVRRKLCQRVYTIATKGSVPRPAPSHRPAAPSAAAPTRRVAAPAKRKGQYKLVAIGTSTGGPVALQEVLTKLPAGFPLPLVLVQHMPASFTPAFAQRLNQLCAIEVREAADGDELRPGVALLAPGGKQMLVERIGGRHVLKVVESDPKLNYKPCVDVTLGSIARAFSGGTVLAVILTGMGADGREGCRLLKQGGSTVWAQDEATSVVYGMPAAVADAGLAEQILPLGEIGRAIAEQV